MARSEARIQVTIWSDPDFRRLSPGAQWAYMHLLSQPDLGWHGVVPLRVTKWARSANGLTPARLREDLAELGVAGYVVVDEDTEELLVRSLIRGDEIYRQPSLMHNAASTLPFVESPAIRAQIAVELTRVVDDAAAGLISPLAKGSAEPLKKMLGELRVTIPPSLPDALVRDDEDPTPKGARMGAAHPSPKGSPEALGERGKGKVVKELTVRTSQGSSSSSEIADATPDPVPEAARTRPEVDELCFLLADAVEANGSRRPSVTKRWRDAARLMLDKDKRTVDQVKRAIEWCQRDEFWRSNVLSMPKLREKYDQLRLAAQRSTNGARASPPVQIERDGLLLNPNTVADLDRIERFAALDAKRGAQQTLPAIGGEP